VPQKRRFNGIWSTQPGDVHDAGPYKASIGPLASRKAARAPWMNCIVLDVTHGNETHFAEG
jgi:hypothetical protein